MRVGTERLRLGLPAKSLLMIGLRGVGKTVLLDRMRVDAEASGLHTLRIEAPEGRALPAPQLRQALLRLSRQKAAKSLKLKYADIEVGFDFDPEAGLPQLPGRMGRAKSYAERLFDFPTVGPLNAAAARLAIAKPAKDQGVDIADMLQRKVTSLGPIRSQLIDKGMVWSPSHGDTAFTAFTAFTVPLFGEFMKRIVPGQDWQQ